MQRELHPAMEWTTFAVWTQNLSNWRSIGIMTVSPFWFIAGDCVVSQKHIYLSARVHDEILLCKNVGGILSKLNYLSA